MRFLTGCSFKRLMREGVRSIAVPLIAFTLVVLIGALGGIRQWLEAQYEDMMDNFPVIAELSNLDGTNTTELRIDLRTISYFTDPEGLMSLYGHTSDLVLRRKLETDMDIMLDDVNVDLVGITSLASDDALTPEIVTFFDGYDETSLQSDDFVGLITEDLLAFTDNGIINIVFTFDQPEEIIVELCPDFLADPDIMSGTTNGVEFFIHAWTLEPLEPVYIYTVVGGTTTTESTGLTVIGTVSGATGSTVYSPFWTVSEIAEELTDEPPYSERLSMTVAENRNLADLKGTASMSFSRVNPLHSTRPFAMMVYDSLFYETIEPLRQNTILVDVATPIVYVISIIVGFLTSMVLTRQRKAEFAVMRSVGIHRRDIFLSALGEQFVLCVIGALLGLSVIALVLGYLSFERTAIFIACYMLGVIFSAAKAARTNVLAILRERE